MEALARTLTVELVGALESGKLSKQQAHSISRFGQAALNYALLWLSNKLDERQGRLAAET